MEKKRYEVKKEGWLDATYRKPGDILIMTAAQAESLLIVGSIAEYVEKDAKGKPARQLAAPEAPAAE